MKEGEEKEGGARGGVEGGGGRGRHRAAQPGAGGSRDQSTRVLQLSPPFAECPATVISSGDSGF